MVMHVFYDRAKPRPLPALGPREYWRAVYVLSTHRVRHRWWCSLQSSSSWHPKRHPGFSSAVWNLAAVHRLLHAMPKAPTTSPSLQELAVRHKPSMRESARCWFAKPMAHLERLQMAVAMSKILPLWRHRVAAPDFTEKRSFHLSLFFPFAFSPFLFSPFFAPYRLVARLVTTQAAQRQKERTDVQDKKTLGAVRCSGCRLHARRSPSFRSM